MRQERYLSIKNFEKFQHYKHRNPPWIRLYYAILDDPAFIALDEVQQCRLIKLFLISSRQNNRILDDPYYIAKMLRIEGQIDLTPLLRSGFLLAERKRRASISKPQLPLISDSSDSSDNSSQSSQTKLARVRAKTIFPDDLKVTEEEKAQWLKFGINAAVEFASFRDHALANGRLCADWEAAKRNWFRKAISMKEARHAVPAMQR